MRHSGLGALLLVAGLAVGACGCGRTPGDPDGGGSGGDGSDTLPGLDGGDGGSVDEDAGHDGGVECGGRCEGVTPICDPNTGTCVQCLIDAHCSGGTPTCDPATWTCVPPNGETCAGALSISVAPGQSTSFVVDTSGKRNDVSGSCNLDTPNGDAELVFRLTLTQTQDITVQARAQSGSAADPVLYLRKAPCETATELRCVDFEGSSEKLEVFNQEPGQYFIVIETWNGAAGPMDVTVTLFGPTPPPPNDTCAAPSALNLVNGTATVQVDSYRYTDAYQGACNDSLASPEAVYALTLSQPMNVVVTATATAGTEPVLYLRSTCGTGPDLACTDPTGNTSAISRARLPAGTYHLFVEADGSGVPGNIDATVTVTAPPPLPSNDTCAAPAPVNFSGGTATFQVDAAAANDDYAPSCNAMPNSPDAVYAITLAQAQDVIVSARGTNGAVPVLSLTRSPCGSGTEVACVSPTGSVSQLIGANLQAGTYFLFVEAKDSAASAPIDVTVTLAQPSTPPANDTCASAETLVVAPGNPVTVQANTRSAGNDAAGSCNQDTAGGDGEVVYRVALANAQDLRVTATASATPAADPVVYVRAGSCSTGAELSCADVIGAREELLLRNLAPGDYFIFVETWNDLSGPMNVTVALEPPTLPPANDACGSATPIGSLPATLTGSTWSARHDAEGCGDSSGPDVVYAITTPAAGTLRASVLPDAASANSYQPTIYVGDAASCPFPGAIGVVACAQASGIGQRAELVAENLPAGTWYLVVDGAAASSGKFTLDVRLDPQTGAPSNEACATATALTLTGGTAVVEGTTTGAANDTVNAKCSTVGSSGPDVFYSFATPPLSGNQTALNARVSLASLNASVYEAVLNLRQTCGGTTVAEQLVCDADANAAAEAGGIARGLTPASNYFVVVDSASAPGGPFRLQVDVAPVPAPNDSCAKAQALSANTSVGGTTLGAANDHDDSSAWFTGAANCTDTFDGAEVVYAYTAASSGPLTVNLQPQPGFDPGLAVLAGCQVNSCVVTTDQGLGGDPERVTFLATAGTTYYFVVDSSYGATTASSQHARGRFVISVSP